MNKQQKGFTLVELSIVILIIGIIIAGVAGGAKLLEQAELRGVIADMQKYKVAMREFKLTYDAVPGDFRSAAVFFPNCSGTQSHCNGNGDGIAEQLMNNTAIGDGTGDELGRAMRHLYLAGIIGSAGSTPPTNYDGITSIGSDEYFPRSKIEGSSHYIAAAGIVGPFIDMICSGGVSNNVLSPWPRTELVNALFTVSTNNTISNTTRCLGGMVANKAFQIDRKIDDAGVTPLGVVTGASTGDFRTVNDSSGGNACVTGDVYNVLEVRKTCIPGLNLK